MNITVNKMHIQNHERQYGIKELNSFVDTKLARKKIKKMIRKTYQKYIMEINKNIKLKQK